MQRAATAAATGDDEATPFWIGAGDEDDSVEEARDVWEREQEEMRRLCDGEGKWNGVLDPELRGM